MREHWGDSSQRKSLPVNTHLPTTEQQMRKSEELEGRTVAEMERVDLADLVDKEGSKA